MIDHLKFKHLEELKEAAENYFKKKSKIENDEPWDGQMINAMTKLMAATCNNEFEEIKTKTEQVPTIKSFF